MDTKIAGGHPLGHFDSLWASNLPWIFHLREVTSSSLMEVEMFTESRQLKIQEFLIHGIALGPIGSAHVKAV